MYHLFFTVVDFKPDPEVLQRFRCQGFGHHHRECTETKQKCLRCGGDHRVQQCEKAREDAKCCNCGLDHARTYRGCIAYKQAVLAEKEKRKNAQMGNNSSSNINRSEAIFSGENNSSTTTEQARGPALAPMNKTFPHYRYAMSFRQARVSLKLLYHQLHWLFKLFLTQ